jgi:hypothetical protein
MLKPERITFIPPKSFYYRSQFYLLPIDYFEISTVTAIKKIIPRNDNPKKTTVVWEQNFDYINSPLKFRNYLAFSFSENATNFFFIDNEFYLSSVKEMDYNHYLGAIINNKNGNSEFSRPYKKETSFYIKIDPSYGFEYNSQNNGGN